MDVTDRIAVVTGGGRGIGRAIALALAEHGADVVVAGRDGETAGVVANEVKNLGRESMATVAGVTDQASVDRMVPEAVDRFGRVDIFSPDRPVYRCERLVATPTGTEPAISALTGDEKRRV